jgi:signal transduction histidine kinase
MDEVIRLARGALILQLALDVSVIVSMALVPLEHAALVVGLEALFAVPTLTLLALCGMASQRGWRSARAVTRLLYGVILAFTLESIGASLLQRTWTSAPGLAVAHAQIPLLFLYVPTVLGGWVGGRRSVMAWSALGIGASFAGIAVPWSMAGFGFQAQFIPILAQIVIMVMICYFVGALADRQRAEHADLQHAHRQLSAHASTQVQLAASRERLRLARDLHDTLAHTLAALLVQLRAIMTLLPRAPDAARVELERAEQAAQHGLVATRHAITELRAAQVQDLGLTGALRHELRQLGQRSGLRIGIETTGMERAVPEHIAETLFLVAQEALRNVERHAHAASVVLELIWHNQPDAALTLRIADDGVGFAPQAITGHHFGLRGMRERVELLDATLTIRSAPQQGTCVAITIPDGAWNDEITPDPRADRRRPGTDPARVADYS